MYMVVRPSFGTSSITEARTSLPGVRESAAYRAPVTRTQKWHRNMHVGPGYRPTLTGKAKRRSTAASSAPASLSGLIVLLQYLPAGPCSTASASSGTRSNTSSTAANSSRSRPSLWRICSSGVNGCAP